jgi:hypothetical protein
MKLMEIVDNLDVVITLPSTINWDEYQKELKTFGNLNYCPYICVIIN